MRPKILIWLLTAFAALMCVGTGFAAWVFSDPTVNITSIGYKVPVWAFNGEDAAVFANVANCSYLIPSAETTITSPAGTDGEAVRLTNTAGTQGKNHVFTVFFGREYTIGDIFTYKIEFDYYHAQKRSQVGKGIPKLQLMYNTTTRGTEQGGVDTPTAISPFIVSNVDANWWHLEYFVTSLTPIMTDHGDSPISPALKVNGVRIADGTIFDYSGNTAFVVVDNLRLNPNPPLRLGIFNRQSSYAHGKYYWVKVCWSGELGAVNMTFSNDGLAEYTPSNKSPFYIYLKAAGVVDIHITLVAGGTPLAIDWTLTIT